MFSLTVLNAVKGIVSCIKTYKPSRVMIRLLHKILSDLGKLLPIMSNPFRERGRYFCQLYYQLLTITPIQNAFNWSKSSDLNVLHLFFSKSERQFEIIRQVRLCKYSKALETS